MQIKKFLFILFLCSLFVSCCLLKKSNNNKHELILGLTWMDRTFTDTIKNYAIGDTVGLLVETQNFKPGKTIDIKLKYIDDDDGKPRESADSITRTISGIVDFDGFARIVVDTKKYSSIDDDE